MSKEAVKSFLEKADVGWDMIDKLIKNNVIKKIQYKGDSFFKIK